MKSLVVWIYGLGTIRYPAMRTIAVASVEPTRSGIVISPHKTRDSIIGILIRIVGEMLSAVQMASTIGDILSSVILGSILSATISTHPKYVFMAYAVNKLTLYVI